MIKILNLIFIAAIGVCNGITYAQNICDLSKVPFQSTENVEQSYSGRNLIANPYFAKKIWQEFCASSIKAGGIKRARFHSFLYSMNIADIIECRMFKAESEGESLDGEVYYQCAINKDVGSQDHSAIQFIGDDQATRLWSFWQKPAQEFNGEEQKNLDAIQNMGTNHRLFFENDTLNCFKRATGIICIISNDARQRGL